MTITTKVGPIGPESTDLVCRGTPLPLQQHWAYALAIKSYGTTVFQKTLFENGTAIGHALITHRKLFGLVDYSLCMRGPVWYNKNIADTTVQKAFAALKESHSKLKWDFFIAQPELEDTPAARSLMKDAGMRRVMSSSSTLWLDIRPEVDHLRKQLNGKWRNQLKKAEREAMTLSIGGRREHQYSWLLEKESAQRSARHYKATPLSLVHAFREVVLKFRPKESPPLLVVTALSGKDRIASALFLLHGNSATYHMGWTSQKGRALNAHNRVMFEAVVALKARNISFLDMGGLNTDDFAGITRFKLGMGKAPTTYVGTYA